MTTRNLLSPDAARIAARINLDIARSRIARHVRNEPRRRSLSAAGVARLAGEHFRAAASAFNPDAR